MYNYNPFLHLRAEPERNRDLIRTFARQIEADPLLNPKSVEKRETGHTLDILLIGPGLIPTKVAKEKYPAALTQMLVHVPSGYKLGDDVNFEAFDVARAFAFHYNIRLSVVDMHAKCVEVIPQAYVFTYTTDSFVRKRIVQVNRYVHDIREPFTQPDALGQVTPAPRPIDSPQFSLQYDGIIAARVFDRIPHEEVRGWRELPNYLSGIFTNKTQRKAIQNCDALVRAGSFFGVTKGKDAPYWSEILPPAYDLRSGEQSSLNIVAPQVWKKVTALEPAKKFTFTPPRSAIIELKDSDGRVLQTTSFNPDPKVKKIESKVS